MPLPAFGTIRNSDTLFNETAVAITVNQGVATNTTINVSLGTYTMPMDGLLFAEMMAQGSWSGTAQGIGITNSGSSPAPSLTWQADCVEDGTSGNTCIGQAMTFTTWIGLSAGTVVSLNARLNVAYFPATVNFDYVFGTLRAFRY